MSWLYFGVRCVREINPQGQQSAVACTADCKLLTASYLCPHENFDGVFGKYLP
ncbi:MAG TPA: hypothetical protein VFP87_05480 [Chitinophagaceae bacterium]|nr:hypothetical protein [Chitinophagaceae bacterium]